MELLPVMLLRQQPGRAKTRPRTHASRLRHHPQDQDKIKRNNIKQDQDNEHIKIQTKIFIVTHYCIFSYIGLVATQVVILKK